MLTHHEYPRITHGDASPRNITISMQPDERGRANRKKLKKRSKKGVKLAKKSMKKFKKLERELAELQYQRHIVSDPDHDAEGYCMLRRKGGD